MVNNRNRRFLGTVHIGKIEELSIEEVEACSHFEYCIIKSFGNCNIDNCQTAKFYQRYGLNYLLSENGK